MEHEDIIISVRCACNGAPRGIVHVMRWSAAINGSRKAYLMPSKNVVNSDDGKAIWTSVSYDQAAVELEAGLADLSKDCGEYKYTVYNCFGQVPLFLQQSEQGAMGVG